MGRRKDRARTPGLWIATTELPVTGGHPFYQRLKQILDTHAFDACVEAQCAPFYAATVGRPSLTPGTYFRLLLIGYFEGIDSERGIAWRTADSLALRGFLGLGLEEPPPEHSTISRTRRLIDLETHRAINRHRWCPVTVSSRGRSPHWKHPFSHGLLDALARPKQLRHRNPDRHRHGHVDARLSSVGRSMGRHAACCCSRGK